jgi:hypothetical protein
VYLKRGLLTCCVAAVLISAGACLPGLPLPGIPEPKPGEDLATARLLKLDAQGTASFNGTITGDTRAQVFDLGACAAGDRVTVSVDPVMGSQVDPVAAIFNASGEVLALNDDADPFSRQLGAYIDETVWEDGDHYFLAISRFSGNQSGGDYQAVAHIERGGTVPAPAIQILVLDFDGGSIDLPGTGTIQLDSFDAADIDHAYAGHTAQIKAEIVATVRQNYRDTGLEIVTSDDPSPAPGTYSTIYFGAYSAREFGRAQDVDQGNRNRCDDGIVYTDDFDKPFAVQPSSQGIGTAIGNVAAHEAGHLLGLNHVADVMDLMDTTGTASTLLADQEFKTSSLDSSIFPFGLQNGPAILRHVVPPL